MHFIDDVNFVFARAGGEFDVLAQGADLVDAAVGGAVNFQDVKAAAAGDFLTGNALAAGFKRWAFFAIKRLG